MYRWLIVGALAIVMAGYIGTDASFGVFLKPILEEFGWTRVMASGAKSLSMGIVGLVGIVAGRLTDKYGARIIIGIGGLLLSLGYLLMYNASSLWQFYMYLGVIVGLGMASCWTPINATVSRWFTKNTVLALGITASGMTMGVMFFPPVVAHYIIAYGWRLAYIVPAIIAFIAAIPAVVLLGRSPPQGTEVSRSDIRKRDGVDDRYEGEIQQLNWTVTEAAKTTRFWMLIIVTFVTATSYFFLLVHIVAYATDLGIATTSAVLIFTFMGGADILGKLLVPFIANMIGKRFTILILLALEALALFLLMRATSLWMFYVFGSVFGFGFGAVMPIRISMIPEFFGLKSVGTMMGVINLGWATGSMIGPILAAYVFDISGNYDIAFLTSGLLMIIGMVAAYFLRVPKDSLITHTNSTLKSL